MRVSREVLKKIEEATNGAAAPFRKYRNRPMVVGGVRFASRKEARRWAELKLLEREGKIKDLERQVTFDLKAEGGAVVARYVADATYLEPIGDGWGLVVEDSKGCRTQVYKLKKRWMLAQYGIQIRET